ncbi:hypothetical protein CCR75_001915 [Bremia lactucae]|uniref:Uncharacterized protein n=1 Tax=Bremia lactucae TaxID=4779 RepID=A0A976FIG5_BRELC|nr:hypothetical protein CCR75_001915 [Bremia lactucae]
MTSSKETLKASSAEAEQRQACALYLTRDSGLAATRGLCAVDTDMNGKVNVMDIQRGLRRAGVNILIEDVGNLMKRLDPKN